MAATDLGFHSKEPVAALLPTDEHPHVPCGGQYLVLVPVEP